MDDRGEVPPEILRFVETVERELKAIRRRQEGLLGCLAIVGRVLDRHPDVKREVDAALRSEGQTVHWDALMRYLS